MRVLMPAHSAYDITSSLPYVPEDAAMDFLAMHPRVQGYGGLVREIWGTRSARIITLRTLDPDAYDLSLARFRSPGDAFRGGRTVAVRYQYGYANKDGTTYGSWNRRYDLVFTLGPYATTRFGRLTEAREVGHPGFDRFFDPRSPGRLRHLERPHHGRRHIVYLPTWDKTSFSREVLWELERLSAQNDISVKLHPIAVETDPRWLETLAGYDRLRLTNEPTLDLIAAADAVITELSGVALEALAFRTPCVVLLGDRRRGELFYDDDDAADRLFTGYLEEVRHARELPAALERAAPPDDEVLHFFWDPSSFDGKCTARISTALRSLGGGGRSHTGPAADIDEADRADATQAFQLSVDAERPDLALRINVRVPRLRRWKARLLQRTPAQLRGTALRAMNYVARTRADLRARLRFAAGECRPVAGDDASAPLRGE